MNYALTYDDVQIRPCSEPCAITSRKDVDTSTWLSKNIKLRVPFVASPMDTICEWKMAQAIGEYGGIGFIHRFMSVDDQLEELLKVEQPYRAGAIGARETAYDDAWFLEEAGIRAILIDVAHGNHMAVINLIKKLKDSGFIPDIIAGNVATAAGAKNLIEAGADGIRVGIGGGSMCKTRIETGIGLPSITSIEECSKLCSNDPYYVPVMADGGIRFAGDVAKAIVAGASTVMMGSVIAGTKETPGRIMHTPEGAYKVYRGSASYESKIARGEDDHVEGVSTLVSIRGRLSEVLRGFEDGLRSAMTYCNAMTLEDLRKAEFVMVTQAGMKEAMPHGKR